MNNRESYFREEIDKAAETLKPLFKLSKKEVKQGCIEVLTISDELPYQYHYDGY